MTTETVLTEKQKSDLIWTYDIGLTVIKAVERAVLESPEVQALRKDAERYRHIRGGNQWVVAATQTGFHVDGEHLDELIDAEMEQ